MVWRIPNKFDFLQTITITWISEDISNSRIKCIRVGVDDIAPTKTLTKWRGPVIQAYNDYHHPKNDSEKVLARALQKQLLAKSVIIPVNMPLSHCGDMVIFRPDNSNAFKDWNGEYYSTWVTVQFEGVQPHEVLIHAGGQMLDISERKAAMLDPFHFRVIKRGKDVKGGEITDMTRLVMVVCEGDPGSVSASASRINMYTCKTLCIHKKMAERGMLPRTYDDQDVEEGVEKLYVVDFGDPGVPVRTDDAFVTFTNPVRRWWYMGHMHTDKYVKEEREEPSYEEFLDSFPDPPKNKN